MELSFAKIVSPSTKSLAGIGLSYLSGWSLVLELDEFEFDELKPELDEPNSKFDAFDASELVEPELNDSALEELELDESELASEDWLGYRKD